LITFYIDKLAIPDLVVKSSYFPFELQLAALGNYGYFAAADNRMNMQTDYMIRSMRPDDIGSVAALVMRAFLHQSADMSLLHGDFIRLYVDEPAAVNRVAEQDQHLLGVVFGHCWGSLGWLGPVAVSTTARRAGIGRALVEQVTEELRQRGCPAIAVDTERDERILTPFYEQLDFRPAWETVSLVKNLAAFDVEAPGWLSLDDDAEAFRWGVQELCKTSATGMELLPLIELWRARGWGDGFLWRQEGAPVAAAVVMYRKRFAVESPGVVRLCVLLLASPWSAPPVCALLATTLRRRFPASRYLFVRDIAADEAIWHRHGWTSHGYGRRWVWRGLSGPPAKGLLCLE
jgi:predicted N-acetyltransferase YhbS